jgi:hypothetical protein
MHCLRDNTDQRADQLLFSATYLFDNESSGGIPFVVKVHGANACYLSMHRSHIMKKQDHKP